MTNSESVLNLPEEDRPRERLLRHGPEALSSQELLAILLGSGTQSMPVMRLAQQLITHFGSLQNLADATVQELLAIKGIGQAKAIQLKAIFCLGQRAVRQVLPKKPRITHPKQVFELLREELEFEKCEHFVVLMLDTRGCCVTHEIISIGSLTRTLVHPREVFFSAIRHKASAIILAHNHPSGDPTPSTCDFELTTRLAEAGKLMGIPIHDHIVIGQGSYISLRESGFSF